ncbi:hypothetical protein CDL15_Pgr000443 [Punica granatum]|uniref:TF-B3 domain-containing protein n=1 Tax=Punica granatum TaxID=22663 RepID=A0A218W423_PUNGR|nr:hypothetical protein CDL15_Pgr000443 [Punica granatum]
MAAADTSRLLQHPSHKHALVLQELSESFRFECQICSISVKGPAYHCIDCEFFIHKSCAELPPEIQHPSHPQHPLVLSTPSGRSFGCYGCRYPLSVNCYQCYDCRIDLHVGCAVATLPPPEEEQHKDEQKRENKDHHEEEMIKHFAHRHPLSSFHLDAPNWIRCKACWGRISGRVYGCRACIFVLHESCALAPRKIMNHPFHPQHSLTLFVHSKASFRCRVCEWKCQFAYKCNECGFILDVNCAVSIKHPPPRDHDHSRSTDDRRDQIHHFSHPHQLTSFYAKAKLLATCDVCKEEISGDFYCCPDCLFLLHPSCAKLTQEIVHPLHPEHPLICQPGRLKCSLCSNYIKHGFEFKCEECPFGLDVGCALQSLSATKEELTLNSELLHKHPMRLQFLTEGHDYKSGRIVCCECPAEGLVYVCANACDMMIHKTCAELPHELEHPIHPQHPLLLSSEPLDKSNPCFACLESSGGFTYYCDYCKFQFHAHCAMRRPTLKHQHHEHNLSYFGKIRCKPYSVQCDVCYDDCRIDFYRCVPCNYNIHFSCLPLPHSVKHKFHFHPLVLRDRVVDEHYAYEEQYCDLCETLRNPERGVYYCEVCNYAVDIDCVIPKSLCNEFMRWAEIETRCHPVELRHEGRSWPVKMLCYPKPEGNQGKLCHGWAAFLKDNVVRHGTEDICVFELINRNAFCVHIFRCSAHF